MGKDEPKGGDIKTSKSVKQQHSKLCRKTVLGSNTLALFLTPSCSNGQLTPAISTREQVASSSSESCSPYALFNMLKEVNKYMVKGTKLYESLKELRLCGWVSPLTLLLTGPAEDMKVLKHAWIKRHLKNPLGYYIKDVGIVQEFVVELLPQSPFLSLKTALFDAVADLNNQSIFPTKENLREYLRKHYPDVKLPEIRHVHECLGRLVKERRLYHNGCGYFILCNVNVLNELKMFNTEIPPDIICQSSAESAVIKGFALSSSSSPAATELEINSSSMNNTSNSAAETSSIDRAGFPSFLESKSNNNNNNPVRSFFKKHVKTVKKPCPNEEIGKTQTLDKCVGLDVNALPSDGIEKKDENCNISPAFSKRDNSNVSPAVKREKVHKQKNEKSNLNKSEDISKSNKHETKAKSLPNDMKDNEVHKNDDENVHFIKCETELNVVNNEDKKLSENITNNSKSAVSKEVIAKRKPKLNRSHSFDGKVSKTQKDVTFAIVGVPCNPENQKSDVANELSHFKRSHSFGAGSSRKYKKPPDNINLKLEIANQNSAEKINIKHTNSDRDSRDIPPAFYHDGVDDDESSFLCTKNLQENNYPGRTDTDHSPDLLYNYEDLGSSISFHKNNLTHYTVMDLSSPPVSSSLAGELKEVYHGQYI